MFEDRTPAEDVIDKWFSSDAWKEILHDANTGDQDSVDLMENVNDQLASLIFHLKNNSAESRLQYEIKFFQDLCNDFGVA